MPLMYFLYPYIENSFHIRITNPVHSDFDVSVMDQLISDMKISRIYNFIIIFFCSNRGDNDRLATINSVFQTIDLATMSLAPMSAGLIFGLVSSPVGAYFIAASNVLGGFLEYWLLKSIYQEFPELARKKIFEENSKKKNTNFTSKVARAFHFRFHASSIMILR